MDLKTKKQLAARVLGVGTDRVLFDDARLEEIKEALTRQDIKDLIKSKAIMRKEIGGRRKVEKRTTRRRFGKIKKKVNTRKKRYMMLTRKLRKTIKALKKAGTIPQEKYLKLKKEIKSKMFRSRAHLMELVQNKEVKKVAKK
jgi:large subunit ribosomal protein L19e